MAIAKARIASALIGTTLAALAHSGAWASNSFRNGGWTPPASAPTEPVPAGGPATRASTSDPIGDTFGSLSPQLDISAFSASTDGSDLSLGLDFATPITPADSGQPDALFGFIDVDTDQNPTSGVVSAEDVFCPQPSGLGVEFVVDLGAYDSMTGTVGVYDSSSMMLVGSAPTVFGPTSVSVTVPLSLLGGSDGIDDVATVIGTMPEPTDCAPNGGALTSDMTAAGVPTLNALGLILLGLLLPAIGFLRSRRTAPRHL